MTASTEYLRGGDQLECNQGSAPANLTTTNGKQVAIESKSCANETDKNVVANIPTFGTCNVLSGPCAPVVTNWLATKPDVNIGGSKALLKSSTIPCTVGGIVKPK